MFPALHKSKNHQLHSNLPPEIFAAPCHSNVCWSPVFAGQTIIFWRLKQHVWCLLGKYSLVHHLSWCIIIPWKNNVSWWFPMFRHVWWLGHHLSATNDHFPTSFIVRSPFGGFLSHGWYPQSSPIFVWDFPWSKPSSDKGVPPGNPIRLMVKVSWAKWLGRLRLFRLREMRTLHLLPQSDLGMTGSFNHKNLVSIHGILTRVV